MSMELTVLGCNSALPTSYRNPSAQILTVSGRTFLIDCGEGTQFQLRKLHINFMRIDYIFISHIHGDHIFGLLGLISTMSLLNRSTPLEIFADAAYEDLFNRQIAFFCENLTFPIIYHPLAVDKPHVILNIKGVQVQTVPLVHRVPTNGFIFREQAKAPNIRKSAICKYGLSIADIVSIKDGKPYFDSVTGEEVDRRELVIEAEEPKSYAYISDTAYLPSIVEQVKGVSLLYHEATFADDNAELAGKTYHSTAKQAATIARDAGVGKLLIGHYSSRYKETDVLEQEAQSVFQDTTAVYDGYSLVF